MADHRPRSSDAYGTGLITQFSALAANNSITVALAMQFEGGVSSAQLQLQRMSDSRAPAA